MFSETRFLASLCIPVLVAACGGEISPTDQVLLERQKFEVELVSWAPLPDGQVALDLQITVRGKSELERLTVAVHQVDDSQEVLRIDPATLDVAGMDYDDRRLATVHVPSAGEALAAVAVLLENVPEEVRRASYPEFAGS